MVVTIRLAEIGPETPFRVQHGYNARVLGLARGKYDFKLNQVSGTDTTLMLSQAFVVRRSLTRRRVKTSS